MSRIQARFQVLFVFFLIFIGACAKTIKNENTVNSINFVEDESRIATEMSKKIKSRLGYWKDSVVLNQLHLISSQLIINHEELQKNLNEVKIELLDTDNLVLTAGLSSQIYISKGILKSVQYENELAFLIATALAMLSERLPQDKLKTISEIPTSDWFEKNGFFDYGIVKVEEADQRGIDIIISSKYDPRGATSILKRWTLAPWRNYYTKINKFDSPTIDERYQNVKLSVAKIAPSKNAVVKSKRFDELKARVLN